jgi:hypothetical protein
MIRLTQLNEASEVFIEEIPVAKAKQVMAFEKVIGAYIKTPGGHGNYRFEADDLKKLLSLKIRWVEGDNEYVSIGF